MIEQLAVVGEKRTMFEVELSCGKEVDSSYFLRIELNLWIGCLFTGRKIWWSLARHGGLNEKSWAGQQVSEGVKGAALGSPVEEGGYRASAASCLSPCRKVSPILVLS